MGDGPLYNITQQSNPALKTAPLYEGISKCNTVVPDSRFPLLAMETRGCTYGTGESQEPFGQFNAIMLLQDTNCMANTGLFGVHSLAKEKGSSEMGDWCWKLELSTHSFALALVSDR